MAVWPVPLWMKSVLPVQLYYLCQIWCFADVLLMRVSYCPLSFSLESHSNWPVTQDTFHNFGAHFICILSTISCCQNLRSPERLDMLLHVTSRSSISCVEKMVDHAFAALSHTLKLVCLSAIYDYNLWSWLEKCIDKWAPVSHSMCYKILMSWVWFYFDCYITQLIPRGA